MRSHTDRAHNAGHRGATRASVLHLALLLVAALAMMTITGCRRQSAFKDKQRGPIPRNASQAAAAWKGDRVAFTDPDGKTLLKLRTRQRSARVFGPDLRIVGYVRRSKSGQLILTREDPKQPGYLITPDETAGDKTTAYLVHPTQPVEGGSVLNPEVDTKTVVARIVRDTPVKGCATWRFEGADGNPFATLLQVKGKPTKDKPDCDAIDATWQATLGTDGDASWWVSASNGPVRTLQATQSPPEAEQPPKQVAFTLTDDSFPTFAAAPALFPGDDLLLKAGYIRLLTNPPTTTRQP